MFAPFSYLVGVSGDTFYFSSKPDRVLFYFPTIKSIDSFKSHKKAMEELIPNLDPEGNPILFGVRFNF